jgi:DNA replication protein DnaC
MNHEELLSTLRELRLTEMASQYVDIARIAEKQKSTYEQYLAKLAKLELQHKQQLKILRLKKEAKLPIQKHFESYDFTQREGITPTQFNRLAEGSFIRKAENIVFYGSFGVGKTHLSIALTQKLCESGFKCFFTSTNALIEQLLEAKKNLALNQLFKRLDRFDLIACDELGYIPQTEEGANLFFQLISQRTERKSLLITTNLTYSEWDKVFLNTLTTQAAVDRIIHNCETFNITGPSWRAEVAKKRQKLKSKLTDNCL